MPVGVASINRASSNDDDDLNLTWSTTWVLTCQNDCHGPDDQEAEGWVEEDVYVQWED